MNCNNRNFNYLEKKKKIIWISIPGISHGGEWRVTVEKKKIPQNE